MLRCCSVVGCCSLTSFSFQKALELVQDSKATIFLVLELARGGELFDRIKVSMEAVEQFFVILVLEAISRKY